MHPQFLIDLTNEIFNQMLNYPFDPNVSIKTLTTVSNNGYQTTYIESPLHVSTHIDFPIHFYENSFSSSDYDISYFYGKALIINVKIFENQQITLTNINDYFINIFTNYEYLIFNTGWSKFWGTEEYYYHYPYLSNELALFLSELKNLKGIGIDTPSVDKYDSSTFDAHKILLKSRKIIIENLCNIDSINSNECFIGFFPLKIKNSDGTPARVVAFI